MLEIQILRDQRERTIAGLKKRGLNEDRLALVDQIINLDTERKEVQTQLDSFLKTRNELSDQIGILFKSGKASEANELKIRVQDAKDAADGLEQRLQKLKSDLDNALVTLPNIPHSSVPEGKSAEDNKVHKAWNGELPNLPTGSVPHWDLAEKYNLIDFKLG